MIVFVFNIGELILGLVNTILHDGVEVEKHDWTDEVEGLGLNISGRGLSCLGALDHLLFQIEKCQIAKR